MSNPAQPTVADLASTYGNTTAEAAGLDAAGKMDLVNKLTRALGIGGWVYTPKGKLSVWDASPQDVADEWAKLEGAHQQAVSGTPDAFRVAMLIATTWERQCWEC